MENSKIKVDTELEMIEYLQAVNDIALEFFNADGKYQPHIGNLNAMRLFYNLCVKNSEYDEKYGHDIFDAIDMKEIVADKEFIKAFNESIRQSSTDINFTFGCAYITAMDIVKNRQNSLENTIDIIQSALMKLIDSFNETINGDTLKLIIDAADKMANNQIEPNTIVDAYIQSTNKNRS